MSVGWSGPDPTGFTDNATDYELGTKYHANSDITINNVRVWSPAGSVAFASRKGRIWSAAGVLQATATLPDQLPSGWSTYALSAPVTVVAGTDIWVSYSVQDTYGAVTAPGYPRTSGDGLVAATGGALNGAPTAFPNSAQATFYGVDIDYTAGLAGNQRPVVGITAAPAGYLTANATLTITDDFPATVTYVIEWGDGSSSGVATLGPHQHVYAAAGTYAVMVTATDAGGLTDSAATVATVIAAPGALDPNAEQVAVRWLQGVNGITSGMVATTLPRDNGTWAASGFVRVDGIVGGEIDAETGYRSAVASLTLWAATPTSGRPPWWKAARLGGLIIADCAPPGRGHRLLTIGTGYRNARVMGAVPLNDPRRVPGDPGAYAKYQMDLSLSWAIV